jgi:hypothetical protein
MDLATPVLSKPVNYITGTFNDTGANTVDIDLVSKKWSHLWWISQYGTEFTLIKKIRKDSTGTDLKTQISATQAGELIEKLGLGAEKSTIFRKAISWR